MESVFHREWEIKWLKFFEQQCNVNLDEWTTNNSHKTVSFVLNKSCIKYTLPVRSVNRYVMLLKQHEIGLLTMINAENRLIIYFWTHVLTNYPENELPVPFIEEDKWKYVSALMSKISLVCMHEQCCDVFAENDVERCFADNFLLLHILHYIAYFL